MVFMFPMPHDLRVSIDVIGIEVTTLYVDPEMSFDILGLAASKRHRVLTWWLRVFFTFFLGGAFLIFSNVLRVFWSFWDWAPPPQMMMFGS